MDLQTLSTFIGNYAFPIVCCFGMFYMWNKEREEHKSETAELAQAINNNTIVMQKLIDKLEE